MSIHTLQLQAAASLLVESAVEKAFSTIHSISSSFDEALFSVTFQGVDLAQEHVSLIQEQLASFIQKDLPVQSMEMLRKNAQELAEYKKLDSLQKMLKTLDCPLVHLMGVEDRFCVLAPPHVESTKDIGVVEIFSCEKKSDGSTVITGAARSTRKELRQLKKAWKEAKVFDPVQIAQKLKLFSVVDDRILWWEKGIVLKNTLFQWVKNFYCDEYRFVEAKDFSLKELVGLTGPLLLFTEECWIAQEVLDKERIQEALHSSLQFLCKTGRIFGFQDCVRLQVTTPGGARWKWMRRWIKDAVLRFRQEKPEYCVLEENEFYSFSQSAILERGFQAPCRITMNVCDSLGRWYSCGSVSMDFSSFNEKKKKFHKEEVNTNLVKSPVLVCLSVFGSLEQFILRLLEQHKGCLPLWLAPEQVRIVVSNHKDVADLLQEQAHTLAQELKKAGIRAKIDCTARSLRIKIQDFEQAAIPYVAVLGPEEVKQGCMTLRRSCDQEVTKGVTPKALVKLLKEEIARNENEER